MIGPSGNGEDGEARFQQILVAPKPETRGIRGKATTTLAMLDHTRSQKEYAQLQEMVERWQSEAMDKWLAGALPIFVTTFMDEIAERFMRKEEAGYPSTTPSYLFTDWGERQLKEALEESVHLGEIERRNVSNGIIFLDESFADTLQLQWELRSSKGCSKVGQVLQAAEFCTENRASNGWSTRVSSPSELKTLSLGRAAKSAAEPKALRFGS